MYPCFSKRSYTGPLPRIPFCLLLAVGSLLFFSSCDRIRTGIVGKDDRLLAEAYHKKLYLSELQGFIPDGASERDSTGIARAYIEKWIRENLLLVEAEKKLPQDLELDRLVRDYRSTLIISNYEKWFVEQHLDTIVSEQEVQQYYEANKQQYQLETTIVRSRVLKLRNDMSTRDRDFVRKNWLSTNKMDLRYLQRVCREHGEMCHFAEKKWLKLDQIKAVLPAGAINESVIRYNREYVFNDNTYSYYLKIFESVSDKETAPLSFVAEQAEKYILHQRKLRLLEELKETLYEKESTGNNVKVYSN